MNGKIKAWIIAIRFQTLSLSVSGVVLSGFIVYSKQLFDINIFLLVLSTTLLLQILSNLANDYGDYKHGTDNNNRIGPTRALQSGVLSVNEMRVALYVIVLLTFASGILLLLNAFNFTFNYLFIVFLIIGVLAIGTAIKYTVGKKPFGYNGLGDIMVFIFFGIVSVVGTYFLFTKQIDKIILLPATSIGLLSAGVLNINNLRDIENDKISNKNTLAVKMGVKKNKLYHITILALSIALLISYLYILNKEIAILFLIIPIVLLVIHGVTIFRNKELSELNKELKKLSLITLLVSVLVGVGIIL